MTNYSVVNVKHNQPKSLKIVILDHFCINTLLRNIDDAPGISFVSEYKFIKLHKLKLSKELTKDHFHRRVLNILMIIINNDV